MDNLPGMKTKVIRSARRRKTVSASIEGDVLVVRIPARFSRRQEQHWVEHMRERVVNKRRRSEQRKETGLGRRAERLNQRYFEGKLEFSIKWVTNQSSRWGSCTPVDRTIRISHVLKTFPDWVLDYVIVHELAHLLVADHSPRFWALVNRYPRAERAIGYLEGYVAASEGH